jgi:anaerobic magnesium-protoporphyrin IX monomethyl ester cyclase
MAKRLLLITPPYHCGVVEVAGRWLPLNMLYIATSARRAGVEVSLFDAMTRFDGMRQIRAVLKREKPDYIGICSITATVPAALKVAKAAREIVPKSKVIVGGVHPTFMAEEFLRSSDGAVDYIVCGEGERTTEELLRALEAGREPEDVPGLAWLDPSGGDLRRTVPRMFSQDLEEYPPAFDIVDWSLYRYFVIPNSRLGAVGTSRGCDHLCTFCSQQKFWERTWRGRRPEAVVAEMEMLYRRHGANVLLIGDEYPTRDAARWEEILDRLIALDLPLHLLMETRAEDIVRDERILHKYRKAGIVHVYVGLESTEQETLDRIQKELSPETSKASLELLRAHGMLSETSFVLGFPEETQESVERTLALAKRYDPDMAHFLCITPWPYSDLWAQMEDRVRVRDYSKYNLVDPVVAPKKLGLRGLDRAIIRCYMDFYMSKVADFGAYPDAFRRDYMLTSMKLIMKSSFLAKKMGSLAMPPGMGTGPF